MDGYAAVQSEFGEKFEVPHVPHEYWGYKVQDPLGQEIGSVETLFLNNVGEPQYVRVKTGRLWPKFVLLPIGSSTLDETQRVLMLGAMRHA